MAGRWRLGKKSALVLITEVVVVPVVKSALLKFIAKPFLLTKGKKRGKERKEQKKRKMEGKKKKK